MRKFASWTAISLAATALLATAPAHAELISPRDPEAIRALIEAHGWPATLNRPDDENPFIESELSGVKFLVFFMNCNDNHRRCTTIKYYMGFSDAKDATFEEMNDWNKAKRFGRAFIDDEGDPVLEMDLDLDFKGLPRENVNESLNIWASLMDAFYDHLYVCDGVDGERGSCTRR